MKTSVLLWLLGWLVVFPAFSQEYNLAPLAQPASITPLPMDAELYELADLAERYQQESSMLSSVLRSRGYYLHQGRVSVTLSDRNELQAVNPEVVRRHGGQVAAQWEYLTDAWVPLDSLLALANDLPAGIRMQANSSRDLDFEGPLPTRVNSQGYKNNGANGTGKTVAIIDNGYFNVASAINPGVVDSVDFTGTGFYGDSTGTHGGACYNRVSDHAPGARYYLMYATGSASIGQAIDSCIAWGVDVISLSQSRQNTGWNDNSGWFCTAVLKAANAGILVFNSSGNKAHGHWQGNLKDSDNDNWHEWANNSSELNSTILEANNDGTRRSIVIWLQWQVNVLGDQDAYGLYLYRLNTGQPPTFISSDINGSDNFSRLVIYTQQDSTIPDTLAIAIRKQNSGTPQFEVIGDLSFSKTFVVNHPEGSTTSPSNSLHARVITIGAVNEADYFNGNGTSGIVTNYSSQGPTNGGATRPLLIGPTNTGGFIGTSCSTPESAGATLAFWSSQPTYSADAVRYMLLEFARTFKDWGSPGPDNVYGFGGIYLYDYADGTVWASPGFSNTNGLNTGPYYHLNHACNAVPDNGRVLFLGHTYTGNLPYLTAGNKKYSMKSIINDASLGY